MGYYGGDSSRRDYNSLSAFLSGVDTISCVSLYNIIFKPLINWVLWRLIFEAGYLFVVGVSEWL